ncbi:MAG: hypothetical protein LAP38_21160 [Acidobacteriia bacterium]|nr:hypothetical protein [Terriglobia bacterium]
MSRRALAGLAVAGCLLARPDLVRYLRWPQIQPLIRSLAASGEKLPEFASAPEWDTWIRQRDYEIRGRIGRLLEDSISGLIVFGTSFTKEPRLANEQAAVNAAGDLAPVARARIDEFIQALDSRDDERYRYVLDFLRRERVTEDELRAYLAGILRRSALERAQDPNSRELAPLLKDFAAAETLRLLKSEGHAPGRVRRVAVIAPTFNFSGGPDGYDFFPIQTTLPFSILEAALRLGLAEPGDVQVVAFDLHPFALAQMRALTAKARAGGRAVLELGRNTEAGWNSAAVSYWSHFGEIIAAVSVTASGTGAPPTPVPAGLRNLETRTLTLKPQLAARISVEDIDIVAQSAETTPGAGFDLVVALDAFSRYNRLEQSLALESISEMTNPGGIVLVRGASPAAVPRELERLGLHNVAYAERDPGINIGAYRRQ